MKARIIFISLFVFILSALNAGPFGLDFGWKLGDLKENKIAFEFKDYKYNIALYEVFPIKKHDLMDHYYVYIDANYGIVEIRCHFVCPEYYDYRRGNVKVDSGEEISTELNAIYHASNFYFHDDYNNYWLYDYSFNRWTYEKNGFKSLSFEERKAYKLLNKEEYMKTLHENLLYIIEIPSQLTGFSKRNEWDELTCSEWEEDDYTINDIVVFRSKDFDNAYNQYLNSSNDEIILNSPLI